MKWFRTSLVITLTRSNYECGFLAPPHFYCSMICYSLLGCLPSKSSWQIRRFPFRNIAANMHFFVQPTIAWFSFVCKGLDWGFNLKVKIPFSVRINNPDCKKMLFIYIFVNYAPHLSKLQYLALELYLNKPDDLYCNQLS